MLAAALVVAPAAVAAADPPACRGLPATIVGEPGQPYLAGTDGDDVIVSNGAATVDGRAGDDVICANGDTDTLRGGDGDDVLDATNSPRLGMYFSPGPGDDEVYGTPGDDEVHDTLGPGQDTGDDVIRVGAGDDVVMSGNQGDDVRRDDEVIDLGPGADTLVRLSDPRGSTFTGGSGQDALQLTPPEDSQGRVYTIDNAQGQARVDDEVVGHWSGFEDFTLVDGYGYGSLVFRGTAAAESLTVARLGVGASVRMGGGNDAVTLSLPAHDAEGEVRGGPGQDRLHLDGRDGVTDVTANLGSGALSWSGSTEGHLDAPDFEALELDGADEALLTGSSGADRITTRITCRTVLRGRKGPDVLDVRWLPHDIPDDEYDTPECPDAETILRGGRGNDVLRGRTTDDVLLGGPGHDRANGGAGRDRCVVEVREHCESR